MDEYKARDHKSLYKPVKVTLIDDNDKDVEFIIDKISDEQFDEFREISLETGLIRKPGDKEVKVDPEKLSTKSTLAMRKIAIKLINCPDNFIMKMNIFEFIPLFQFLTEKILTKLGGTPPKNS